MLLNEDPWWDVDSNITIGPSFSVAFPPETCAWGSVEGEDVGSGASFPGPGSWALWNEVEFGWLAESLSRLDQPGRGPSFLLTAVGSLALAMKMRATGNEAMPITCWKQQWYAVMTMSSETSVHFLWTSSGSRDALTFHSWVDYVKLPRSPLLLNVRSWCGNIKPKKSCNTSLNCSFVLWSVLVSCLRWRQYCNGRNFQQYARRNDLWPYEKSFSSAMYIQ